MFNFKRNVTVLSAIAAVSFGFSSTSPFDHFIHPILLSMGSSLNEGSQETATVTMDNAGTTDTVVSLASNNTSVATVPSTVTVLAGNTTAQFSVSGVGSGSVAVSATANSVQANGPSVLVRPSS